MMAENRAKVEAIAEAGREDPGIETGTAHDVETAERGVIVPSVVVSSQVFLTSALSDQPLPSEMSKPACSMKPQAGSISILVAPSALSPVPVSKKMMYCTPAPT